MKHIYIIIITFITFQSQAQIPEGYYSSAENLNGPSLKAALNDIIKGHTEYPYTSSTTDTWDILKETDRDTAHAENVILFYSGWSVNAAQEYNEAQGWSREHVWAKSHGDFGTDKGAGTDVHHLRPCDISVNSARGNDDFDSGGSVYIDGDGATESKTDADSWEPRDAVKGDVARMLFYIATRYEGESGEPDLELVDEVETFDLNETGKGFHGKLSILLQWHESDPVDSFEIRRNDIIYTYQANRNPFIDHPEYVDKIWSTATGTKIINDATGLRVYPNPARDYINIETSQTEKVYATVYTFTGDILGQRTFTGSCKLTLSNLSRGMYILRINTKNRILNTKTFTKR